MSQAKSYSRDANGKRFALKGGLDTMRPPDQVDDGRFCYLQNVRALLGGRITGRATTGNALYTLASPAHTIVRLNDSTPSGPVAGYVRVIGAAGLMYVNAVQVGSGFSGNPLEILPFGPDQSVQPWAYVGDSSQAVTIAGATPASVSPIPVGSSATWTNPANATSTSLYATYTGGILNTLNLTVSGLAIPLSATIKGIGVTFKAFVSAGAGPVAAGISIIGSTASMLPLSTTPSSYNLGGPTYKWGAALTPAALNAGFSFNFDSSSGGNTTSINNFVITIYYATATNFTCTGMVKVRSDGLTRKTGIMEPQSAPLVGINTIKTSQYLSLPANTPPWTNIEGVNEDYNYSGTDIQPPYPAIIATPVVGSTVSLTVSGTATVNGGVKAPGDSAPATAGFPGAFITLPEVVIFAFTDANGNIVAKGSAGGSPPVVGNVGASATLTVPQGAAQLQIGIDSLGGSFAANSGSYLVQAIISTSAITQVASLVGNVNAYVWGDSPHSGPVAGYIWKNPNDSGTGFARTIGNAQATAVNNSLIFDSAPEDGTVPVLWSTLDATGATVGSIDMFSPALESEGYQDFNACVVGSLWIPQGGTYSMQLQYKDQIMLGIGGGATSTGGTVYGLNGQSISVVNSLPLLFVSTVDGAGGQHTTTISVTFPAAGIYQFELDWDYWFHTGRSLIVEMAPTPGAGVALIPPLPHGVRTGVQYWGKYRAGETGAQSNPGPASPIQLTPVLANTIQMPYSNDPQTSLWDLYRQDDGLANPTYVATGQNDGFGGTINGIVYNTAIEDTLDDLGASGNQLMQRDDFEPFPSIDTPKSGFVTIVNGVVNWKAGDQFNTRWLPGTLMLIGSPTQNAYSLVARPISTTQIVIPTIPDTIGDAAGEGVPYNIAQPILAQQPLPSMWGPDAYGFMHACGDPNQPGAYVWTKAYNPDSAPQTNRLLLASPSETLMGGDLVNGISMVFSPQRGWLMYPNFADAQATTEGISGNQWNPILAQVSKGLFVRNCLCSLGGRKIAFRASDGICITSGGPEQSLTDETLYNLFPHENFAPSPVTLGSFTVYPPNDALPQKLKYQNGYLYYDYQDVNSVYRTLVYDEAAKGWSVDVGQSPFTCHSGDFAPGVSDTAVGCFDNTVRVMQAAGTEAATSVVATGADNAGDARALKRVGDVFIKALVQASNPITVGLYSNQYGTTLGGFSPTSLTGTGSLGSYIVDFTSGFGADVIDLAASLSWPTASGNYLELWQPDYLPLPESTQGRPSDWDDAGIAGNKLVRGAIIELNTFNAPKAIKAEVSDTSALIAPNESPVTVNGQTIIPLTFTPFTAHMMRMTSTDGVPWQLWGVKWICDPWVEYATLDSAWSNLGVAGAKYLRGLVLPMDTKGIPATIRVVTSDGPTVTLTATTPVAVKTPVAFAFNPPLIAHEVQVQVQTATAGVWMEEARWDFDPYPEITPEYTPIMEISGASNKFVQGVKLIADTANVPVTFQILYDGGQVGPTFTGTFNGKQTLAFSWTPFTAHDIQIVPQSAARVWWGGTEGGQSEWVFEPYPESAKTWVTELTGLNGRGWQNLGPVLNVEYASTTAITLAFTVDTGNGSIAPASITIPTSGGTQTKLKLQVGPNKWKLIGFSLTSPAPFTLWVEGVEVMARSWGVDSPYRRERPFGGRSSEGANV